MSADSHPENVGELDRLPDDPVRAVEKEIRRARRALAPPVDVHTARRALKRARSELRLGRAASPRAATSLERVRLELRDVGRTLAGSRDREVAVEVLGPGPWSAALANGNDAAPTAEVLEEARASFARCLRRLRPRRDAIELDAAVRQLARSYRRLQSAYLEALERPTATAFHTLRKRAKDLRYQLEWLQPVWPAVLGAWIDQLHDLTDALGRHQDVVVARRAASTVTDPELRRHLVERLRELHRDQRQCRSDALFLSSRLTAESSGPFARRLVRVLETVSASTLASELP